MGVALIAVFTDDASEVEISWGKLQAGFFVGLADGAGVRAFTGVGL